MSVAYSEHPAEAVALPDPGSTATGDDRYADSPSTSARLYELIECPACQTLYSDPQILPCQHSVCVGCLGRGRHVPASPSNSTKSATKSAASRSANKLVQCPVCDLTCLRSEVRRDINKEQLMQLLESGEQPSEGVGEGYESQLLSGIDELAKCSICGEEPIVSYCRQCSQWLCLQCQNNHRKTAGTKAHNPEDVSTFVKQHRFTLEKQHDLLHKAVQRLSKYIQSIDTESMNIDTMRSACMHQIQQLRDDWTRTITQYCDSMETSLMDFVSTRQKALGKARTVAETSLKYVNNERNDLRTFLCQNEPVILFKGLDKVSAVSGFIEKTNIPKVDIKKSSISIKRGPPIDMKQAATLQTDGHQVLGSIPIKLVQRDENKEKLQQKRAEEQARQERIQIEARKIAGGRNTSSRLAKLTPIPNADKQSDALRQVSKATFRVERRVTLSSKPISLKFIKKHLWVIQDNHISIWSLDLKPVKKIAHPTMTNMQTLAEMGGGEVAVACGNGLHLLTKTDKYDARITDSCYVDVVSHNGFLYAVLYGASTRGKIHVYDEQKNLEGDDSWAVSSTVTLPCDGYTTISVSDMVIYVCSVDYAVVYLIAMDGAVIRKFGHKGFYGGPGELAEPRLCQIDFEGTLMVCDSGNDRLQVMNSEGDWSVATFDQPLRRPSCAYFMKRQLYVSQTEGKFQLIKFFN